MLRGPKSNGSGRYLSMGDAPQVRSAPADCAGAPEASVSTRELAGTGLQPAMERDRLSARHWTAVGALAASAISAMALLIWAYREFIATPWLPIYDESGYFRGAVQIWHALRSGGLHALARETWNYHLILGGPFLSPYCLALGFIFGSNTLQAARTASLVAGFLAWVGIVWLAAELADEGKAYAAAIAGVLWGTSPMFLYYTSRSLYDSFALVTTAFCLIAGARFARNGGRWAAVATGFLACLSYEIKCNVGIFLLTALFLGLAYPEIRARLAKDPRGFLAPLTRPWFLLAASALLPLTAFLMVDGVRQLLRYLNGFPFDPLGPGDSLLYYPRSFFREYASTPALAVILLIGVIYWAWKGWSKPAARTALLYVVLQAVSSILHLQKDGRFIWGAVAITASLTGASLAREFSRLSLSLRFAASAVLVAALAYSVWAAPASAGQFFSKTQVAPSPAQQATLLQGLNFIRDNTSRQQTLLVAGYADEGINTPMLQLFLMNPASGELQDMPALPYADLPTSWGISAQPSPFYAQQLEKAFSQNPDASLVILDHEPGSPFRGRLYPWVFAWQENYGSAASKMKSLAVAADLDTRAGLRVTIYRRRTMGAR